MGKKPLYHARVACPDASPDWALLVASELKALLCCETLDDAVDLGALGRYLIYEAVPAPRTIVRGARKLEPGCALAVDQGGETTWRYYDLPLPAGRPAAARREAAVAAGEAVASEGVAVEVREQLAAAVRRRLVADVPLGVFLSGGLDSSAVTALMAEVVPPPEIQTFAIGFEDPSFDESAHARKVAATLGTCHHQAVLSPRLLIEVLPEVTSFLDEPLGDASLVPTFLLARFTRQHVTVALSGDGGDELFAGYPTFQAERLHRLFYAPAPAALRRLATIIAGWLPVSHANISLDFRAKQFLRGAAEPNLGRRHQAWLGSFLPVEIASLLTPDATVTLHGDDPFSDVDAHLRACPSQNPWDLLLYLYCKLYLAEDILVKVDRAAMAVGLETRAPFLDSQIVALACRLPPALRLRRLCSKYILKQALRGRLPEAILRRPKKGFGIPVARWLRGELRPMLADELASGKLRREGFFAPAVVTRVVGDHLAGRRDLRKPLWTLLAFERWLGAWGRGGSCRRAPLAVAP
jgi:asparagine synthase (glutamine-hydrolysing)